MKQLTIYDFGVEEPEDDYSYLFVDYPQAIPDSNYFIQHIDRWFDPKDLYKNIEPVDETFKQLLKRIDDSKKIKVRDLTINQIINYYNDAVHPVDEIYIKEWDDGRVCIDGVLDLDLELEIPRGDK